MGEAKKRYPSLTSCSMDKGFYTAKNRDALDELLDLNVMPKPSYLSAKQRERESHPDFVKARLQHPAIESAINNLQQQRMGLIRTHGMEGFDRSVGLAANIHRLGKVVRKKEAKQQAWHAARAKLLKAQPLRLRLSPSFSFSDRPATDKLSPLCAARS